MLQQRIQQHFFDSADLQYAAAETLARPIADAAQALVGCLTAGGKALACGCGASAGAAQHFAAGLVDRFERERPGLAALALSADASLLGADGDAQCYARQVQALGAPGDVLFVAGAGGAAAKRSAVADDAPAPQASALPPAVRQPTSACAASPIGRASDSAAAY